MTTQTADMASAHDTTQDGSEKTIAVMMPFGGLDQAQQNRHILDFKRLQYIIQDKLTIIAKGTKAAVRYKLKAYNLGIGYIPQEVLRGIADADILIGLITEKNVNVIYELAVRNMLRDETLLIVKDDVRDTVPTYMKEMAHVAYSNEDSRPVLQELEDLSRKADNLSWGDDKIPPHLKALLDIETYDQKFKEGLRETLQRIEDKCPRRPDYILDLVKDLDPGSLLEAWTTYYPYNVLRIKWRRRSGGLHYEPSDLLEPPPGESGPPAVVVYRGNGRYRELFELQDGLPNPDDDDPLTWTALRDRIVQTGIVDDEDLNQFEKDQWRLTKSIVFEELYATARVPLRINANHSREQYRNKSYLPMLAGKRRVGVPNRPHITFLLVVFLEQETIHEMNQAAKIS